MVSNTNKLRTLSLFSGIGGIELGLRRWCKTICYCEIDPYAVGVLVKNMAKGNIDVAPIWSDITTFGESEIKQIRPIECITGGFPCQDISCAGKGAGIKGEQSGLFFEIIRIVRLARPQIIFLENVPALLARGMDTVLSELAESGYDARWKVLSAAEMGAPHKRDRIWIMAIARTSQNVADAESTRARQNNGRIWKGVGRIDRGKKTNKNVADTAEPGLHQRHKHKKGQTARCSKQQQTNWPVEPDVGMRPYGISPRLDKLGEYK